MIKPFEPGESEKVDKKEALQFYLWLPVYFILSIPILFISLAGFTAVVIVNYRSKRRQKL